MNDNSTFNAETGDLTLNVALPRPTWDAMLRALLIAQNNEKDEDQRGQIAAAIESISAAGKGFLITNPQPGPEPFIDSTAEEMLKNLLLDFVDIGAVSEYQIRWVKQVKDKHMGDHIEAAEKCWEAQFVGVYARGYDDGEYHWIGDFHTANHAAATLGEMIELASK